MRKHLSDIKGGGLARICKGTIATFIISDVPGNDLSVIGSGPTVPDPTTYTDALQVLTKYNLTTSVAPAIIEHLKNGANHYLVELVDEQGKISSRCKHYIVGDNKKAVQAAAQRATQLGYTPFVLDHQLLNDTIAEAGEFLNLIINHQPPNKRVCFIAGGETTLHVRSIGIGGRNQHFALSTLHRISEIKSRNIAILSAGTDGSDGPTPAAGAFADAQTLRIAQQLSLTLNDYLKNFDSYSFFHEANSLFITGATGTNVMDIVIAISEPAATSANDF